MGYVTTAMHNVGSMRSSTRSHVCVDTNSAGAPYRLAAHSRHLSRRSVMNQPSEDMLVMLMYSVTIKKNPARFCSREHPVSSAIGVGGMHSSVCGV